jgi:hypothetical protein
MAPVRRGGHARTVTGDLLTWSQADGARGTRWRESIERDGQMLRSLLLETSTTGRPTRLEVTTRAGLLTLHPERDESAMHGNVVTPAGIRHLAFRWSADHELLVLGSPASATIAIRRLEHRVMPGATATLDMLRIDDELRPRPMRWAVERISPHAWHLRDRAGSEERRFTVEDDGRPALVDEVTWPLEA